MFVKGSACKRNGNVIEDIEVVWKVVASCCMPHMWLALVNLS